MLRQPPPARRLWAPLHPPLCGMGGSGWAATRQARGGGATIDEQMRRSRFTVDDLRSRLRRHGIDDMEAVESAWLERHGNVTFVLRRRAGPLQA